MCSPVSRRALGECNAFRSRGFGYGELTFVDNLDKRSPVYPLSSSPSFCVLPMPPVL
jgi:hypothetical protein